MNARRFFQKIFPWLVFCAGAAAGHADDGGGALAARVVILANAGDPGSLQVARHYAERRGVPEGNIVALPMSSAETISWREFVGTIWEPLLRELEARKWIDVLAEGGALHDDAGRARRVITGHRIAYLVVCRGVPLRIEHDQALYRENPPMTTRPEFRANQGAVDSELAALPMGNYPINACVVNPLFMKPQPTAAQLSRVVKVARLDGPDVASALALVDNAIAGEAARTRGNAYVDYGGGVSQLGNDWLERTARALDAGGFHVIEEKTPAMFGVNDSMADAQFYFGWYAEKINGPFTRAGFRFPPGAVALHIHSFSSATLHAAGEGWCGPFVARGVTATFGNVYEPYLRLTHRPDLIAEAMLRGERAGDAAFYALPALSWQCVFVGDPLFRKIRK